MLLENITEGMKPLQLRPPVLDCMILSYSWTWFPCSYRYIYQVYHFLACCMHICHLVANSITSVLRGLSFIAKGLKLMPCNQNDTVPVIYLILFQIPMEILFFFSLAVTFSVTVLEGLITTRWASDFFDGVAFMLDRWMLSSLDVAFLEIKSLYQDSCKFF